MEMTAATVEQMSRMAGQMQAQMHTQMPPDAMKQMQDRLASLPPEQRAMAEQAMKGRMGAMQGQSAAPVTITFKEKASGQKFRSFTCTLYDELRNGERAGEVCAASMDQAHFGPPDVKTFEALAKFMEPMKRMAPQGFSAPPIQQLHGFPVHSVSLKDGQPSYEVSVLSIEQKSADPSLFTVPAGLTKKDMMGGRGPR
jgi:hypothetical protein